MAYEEDNDVRNSKTLQENLDLIEEQRDNAAMRITEKSRVIITLW